MNAFLEKIRIAIKQCLKENGPNTPDFILAQYLLDCLNAFVQHMIPQTALDSRSNSVNSGNISHTSPTYSHVDMTPSHSANSGNISHTSPTYSHVDMTPSHSANSGKKNIGKTH